MRPPEEDGETCRRPCRPSVRGHRDQREVATDKAEAGQGEQDDLFAAANREKKAKGAAKPTAAEAEVVDVPQIENKPLALPAPEPTKKSGKGGKGKKPGKKGGAK